MALTDTLSSVGVAAFGSSMPVLAPSWTTGSATVDPDGMSLTLTGGSWLSPVAAYVRTPAQVAERAGIFLRRPDGGPVSTGASVLSLYPQQYLRLARLYALVLEDTSRPEAALGRPARPVPAHLVLASGGIASGAVDPRDPLVDGKLSFLDQLGQPIDALAVASAFLALMAAHQPLQSRAIGAAFDTNPGLAAMLTSLAPMPSLTRVRLIDSAGMPDGGASRDLTGLTLLTPSQALHNLAGGRTIGKIPVIEPPAFHLFSAEDRRTRVLGLATSGRLGDSVTLPAVPTGITLARDFFVLRVLDLRVVLRGTPAPDWAGTMAEPPPPIRRDEPLTFLTDGNDILGAATAALTGTLTESIVVSPLIDGTFAVPSAAGVTAHWPAFPPFDPLAAASGGAVPIALRSGLAPTAAFLTASTTDVVLTLNGLPTAAAVRAYHRVFSADAVESRGDGAGGIADGTGTVRLLLRDPLGLRRPGQPPPPAVLTGALLHTDVVVVKRTGEARIFGDVTVAINGTAPAPPAASNLFGSAQRRAICRAGILGLGSVAAPAAGTTAIDAALQLLSEGTPRDAPRLPGMARRDLIVAGLAGATGGSWQAVLGAGRLAPELHNASPRLGAPGGAGGRETQAVGVATSGGRLAYDIARAGLRRTTSIVTRMVPLVGGAWDEPPIGPVTAGANTFAGAVLQTVAATCETPELALLRNIVSPADLQLDALIDRTRGWLTTLVGSAGLPAAATTKLNELIPKLDSLKTDASVDESTMKRVMNELLREIAASGWGRRDAQWALQGALARAQRFVYIETPALNPTANHPVPPVGGPSAVPLPPYAADIFDTLTTGLAAIPSLHVIICCPQQPDFPYGFERFADFQAVSRHKTLLNLPTATMPDPVGSRVVTFHPIGFPGRPSRLESTVVIVDDVWAMVGSSRLSRRGLTFDGGADLVCTDLAVTEGRSTAIAAFRRALQADRLGVPIPGPPPTLPSSSYVRLGDGVEAFHEIREMLRAGGLGRIARLAPPEPENRPVSPGPVDVVDPDGESVDLPRLLLELVLAGTASA